MSRVIACPSDVLVNWFLGEDVDGDCEDVNAVLGFHVVELWHRCELCLLLCMQYVHKWTVDIPLW